MLGTLSSLFTLLNMLVLTNLKFHPMHILENNLKLQEFNMGLWATLRLWKETQSVDLLFPARID